VFTEEFLNLVVLWRTIPTTDDPSTGCQSSIEEVTDHPAAELWDTILVLTSPISLETLGLSHGPYALTKAGLFKVFRCYEDTQSAFMSTVIPEPKGGTDFPRFHEIHPVHRILVPPRIYSHSVESHTKPLAGLRFGVKDIFDLAGTHTSAGCRAFRMLYGKREKTASAVKMLLDLGAQIVGKTKTTPFANGEDAQEWIDYSCPWNPRGN
jgi:hypothetical protein